MKVCKICGTKNFDFNTHCEKCEQPLDSAPMKISSLSRATEIIMIIGTVLAGIAVLVHFVLGLIVLQLEAYEEEEQGFQFFSGVVFFICLIVLLIEFLACFFTTRYYRNSIYADEKVGTIFMVWTLIFINLIAGILMFCDANSEEKTVVKVDNNDMETKLKQYKKLLDQGLITQEEFDTKRKEILKL